MFRNFSSKIDQFKLNVQMFMMERSLRKMMKNPIVMDIFNRESVYADEPNNSDMPFQSSVQGNEHAVLVNIKLSDHKFPESSYYKLEDRLKESIIKYGVGELDGNGIGEGYWTIYMYGPDANKLFETIEPTIKKAKLPIGSFVIKRYGEPGSYEDIINI